MTFGGNAPGLSRWVVISVVAATGLALCVAALRGHGTAPGVAHLAAIATVGCLATLGSVVIVGSTVNGLTNPAIACRDDTSLATVASAAELRAGQNPYAAYDEVQSWAAACGAPTGSPLRSGSFAGAQTYPTQAQIQQEAKGALGGAAAPAIERRLSYPAGSVLVGLAGEVGLVLLTLTTLLVACVAIVRRAAAGTRLVTGAALLAQTSVWTVVDSGHADGIAIGLAALAWIAPSSMAGAALLGAACAIKQTAWFLVLPFVATVWRREGSRAALRCAGIAALVFAACNAPFVLTAPGAWLHAVLGPMLDGLFPQGDGLVALITAHGILAEGLVLLGLLPVAAVVAAALLAVRFDSQIAGVGALAGSLALWFGQRSLPQYFVGIGFLVVALAAASMRGRAVRVRQDAPPCDVRVATLELSAAR